MTQDYFERAKKTIEVLDNLKEFRYTMGRANRKLEQTDLAPFVKAVSDERRAHGDQFITELLFLQGHVEVWLDVLDPDKKRGQRKTVEEYIPAKRREAGLIEVDHTQVIETDVAYPLVVRRGGEAR